MNAQPSTSNYPDYKSIDNYITENYIGNNDQDCINILFSSNDCDKCILYLHTLLTDFKQSSLKDQITINIITDNIAYAKKNLNKYNLKYKYYYDSSLFTKFEINSRTLLYLKKKDEIITDSGTIANYLLTKKTSSIDKTEVVFKFVDTLVNPDKITSTILPYDYFLTLDRKMDVAILYKKTESEDVDKSYIIKYLTGKISDSLKLFNLPERIENPELLKKTSFKNFSETAKSSSLQLAKIHSITSNGTMVYASFTLNRLFDNLQQKGRYALLGNNFIAVKKIKNEKELTNLMNIDDYDDFYLVDTFEYEGDIYPTSVWIYSTPEIIDKNTFITNVNKVVKTSDDLEFGGKATVLLDPKSHSTKMIALDKNAKKVSILNNTIKLNGFSYKIEKQITDVSNNSGFIQIIKKPTKE